MRVPLNAGFYEHESLPISSQECVNLYLNIPRTGKPALLSPSGIKSATTAGSSYTRGCHVFKGSPYFVQGSDLYRVDQTISYGSIAYSATKVNGGTSITGTGRVMLADNGEEGDELVIIDPSSSQKFNCWIYDGSSLTAVSDNDFDGPVSSVLFLDGYFVFTKKSGQKFFISDLRDGTNYISTDFANAEADPDNIVGQMVINNTLYVFGQETFQPFQNVGGSGFPFLPIPGGVQRKGLSSQFAITEVNGLMIFLGAGTDEDPAIWASDGGLPQKISSDAIDSVISGYSSSVIDGAFSFKYSQRGAQFVGFTFPGQATFVFDFSSKAWHTRESFNSASELTTWRLSCIAHCFGELIVGDLFENKIGILDKDTYSEYGSAVPWRFSTPQIENDGFPFFVNSVELVAETGVGDTSEAEVTMSYSRDSGRTFEGEFTRGLGKEGEYTKRVIWNSLGRFARDFRMLFEGSGAFKWAFRGLEVNYD